MATYCFKNRGAALPYEAPMQTVLRRKVDLPDLVSNPEKLALASAPTVGLTSFTGFVQNDVLELWEVPQGTVVKNFGTYVSTAEGATAAATIGVVSDSQTSQEAADTDCFMASVDLNTTGYEFEPASDIDASPDNVAIDVYITDGSIDMTFTTDDTYAAAIFWVWCEAVMGIPA
jgi:hypothetical protein